MPTLKTNLKLIAFSLTILSGIFAMSTSFSINNYLINIHPKYQKLKRAIVTLLDFKYESADKYKFSALSPNDVGFREFLSVMYNNIAISYDKKEVTGILMIKTGTYIGIGEFEATPQYLLGFWISDTFKDMTVMYQNDTQTWIQHEKQKDLQFYAFIVLLIAVTSNLVSDYVYLNKGRIRLNNEKPS